jgi:protein-disulfide isomerase
MEEKNNPIDETQNEFQGGENTVSGPSDQLIIKRSHLYSVLLPLAFVAGLALGFIFWGREESGPTQVVVVPDTTAVVEQPREVKRYDVSEDDDPVFGPEDAPITIIEFSDFECPYCRKWHIEVWPRLQEAYEGQIRLVYRDFPLTNIHPNATPAASAANCAREQDRYWEFNERLFSGVNDLSVSGYQAYAEELEMDMSAFGECLDSGRYNDEVMADFEYAANLGVSSTPTFFVNGIPVVGAQPYDVFSQLIEQELAGEIP